MNSAHPHSPALPAADLAPSFKSRVVARIAASRDPVARLLGGRALELYYEAGDAHSQLCAGLARQLLPRLKVPPTIRLVPAPDASSYPEEARQRAFAFTDASRLAPCHGLPAPVELAPEQRAALEARLAAASHDPAAFLAAEQEGLRALTAGRALPPGPSASLAQTQALLCANAGRRQKLGHYLPAMWQYHGEWFWALDRLEFLHARLVACDGLSDVLALSVRDDAAFPEQARAPGAPLEFWFSFRSPYSYLAAVELLRLRQQGWFTHLQVRPVLPMVMRGLPVPRNKRMYIVRDVKRCADAAGVPFGRIHDPVGDGVLRLLTAFPYSADTDTQLRYCAVAGQTVWAEGLDVCRDDVLRSVFSRSGLDWPDAQQKLAGGSDTRQAEINRDELFAAGLWGVPSFRWGGFTTWGQDRLWMLRQLSAS